MYNGEKNKFWEGGMHIICKAALGVWDEKVYSTFTAIRIAFWVHQAKIWFLLQNDRTCTMQNRTNEKNEFFQCFLCFFSLLFIVCMSTWYTRSILL